MKILIILLWDFILGSREKCGYFGKKGKEIEKKLDDCFKEKVNKGRV